MKQKKKIQDLVHRGNGGFTLVELIVVIAILAILSGVAVPAYSGYVNKANEAADQTLLASVNTAFAAACNVNGESNTYRTDNPSFNGTVLNTANDDIDASFGEFYEEGTFKTMGRFSYVAEKGVFEGYGSVFSANADWSGLAGLSTYLTGSAYDIDALPGTIDKMTSLLAADNGLNTLLGLDGFQKTMESLGLTAEDDPQTLANAAVLYAAQNLKNIDSEDLREAILADGGFGTNYNNYVATTLGITDPTEAQLLATGLQYGMAQAYVDSLDDTAVFEITDKDGNKTQVNAKDWFAEQTPDGLVSAGEILNIVNQNDGLAAYYADGDQSLNDLNFFTGMMGVLDQNAGEFESLEGTGLFSSDEVTDVLNQYFGSEGGN